MGRSWALASALLLFHPSSQAGASSPLWDQISGEKALAHVQHLVDLGPRPPGSAALEQARLYLEKQLQSWGWKVCAAAGHAEAMALLDTLAQPPDVIVSDYRLGRQPQSGSIGGSALSDDSYRGGRQCRCDHATIVRRQHLRAMDRNTHGSWHTDASGSGQ